MQSRRCLIRHEAPAKRLRINQHGLVAERLDSLRDAAVGTNGPLEQVRLSLERETEQIAKNRDRMEQREQVYRTRIEKQFAGMDARIGALKATQSYLEQQIKLWNNGNG